MAARPVSAPTPPRTSRKLAAVRRQVVAAHAACSARRLLAGLPRARVAMSWPAPMPPVCWRRPRTTGSAVRSRRLAPGPDTPTRWSRTGGRTVTKRSRIDPW